jgi:hypothetical protein
MTSWMMLASELPSLEVGVPDSVMIFNLITIDERVTRFWIPVLSRYMWTL